MSDKEKYIDCCTKCGIEVEGSEDRYTCPDCGYNGPNCGKCYGIMRNKNTYLKCANPRSLCSVNGWNT